MCLLLLACTAGWAPLQGADFPEEPEDFLTRIGAPRMVTPPRPHQPEHVDLVLEAIYLREKQLPAAERARLEALVARLGHDRYREREAASEALRQEGAEAVTVLGEACSHPDPEIRIRARALHVHARAKHDLTAHLDWELAAKHFATVLEGIRAPELLERFARHLPTMKDRDSVHGAHRILSGVLIDRLLEADDSVSEHLAVLLEDPEHDLSIRLLERLRANNGERLARLPSLLLDSLRHPEDELPALVLSSPIRPPLEDPRREELREVLSSALERSGLGDARLNAARTLAIEFHNLAGARFLVERSEGPASELVVEALTAPSFLGQPLAPELVDCLGALRTHRDRAIRRAAIGFLLTRPEPSHRATGIEAVPNLFQDDLEPLAEAVNGLLETGPLRAELREAHPDSAEVDTLLDLIELTDRSFDPSRFEAPMPPAFQLR